MTAPPLRELTYFVAVVRAAGFTKAARELGLTRSALSHAISHLEGRLGVRLLNRTTRSVTPTAAGEQVLSDIAPALESIVGSLNALALLRHRPSGRLRVTLPRIAATLVVAPRLVGFLKAHPDVELELSVDDATIDIIVNGFDAGIRFHERVARDMIAVPISRPVEFAVVGAPSYFPGREPIETPHDLMRHDCIRYRMRGSGAIFDWEFEQRSKELSISIPGRLTLDAPEFMIGAALDGVGLAYVPLADVEGHLIDGRLRRVLADWCPAVSRLYLYHVSRRFVSPALRAFIDWLKLHPNETTTRGEKLSL